MTLIMGMSYKDEFIMISADTKVTQQEHDSETFEKIEHDPIDVGHSAKKVHPITKNTFLATGGIVKTGEIIREEFTKRLKPEHTLEKCADILQEVIDELWKKRKSFEEVGDDDLAALSLNFLGTKYFSCYMLGFFENGKTGMAYILPGSVKVEIIESPMDYGYPNFIISPNEDDNENYKNWISIRKEEEQTLNNFMTQFYLTHGKLSLKHRVNVSSDFNVFGLFKDPAGNIQYFNNVLDSSDLYPMFEKHPEMDFKTFYPAYR